MIYQYDEQYEELRFFASFNKFRLRGYLAYN